MKKILPLFLCTLLLLSGCSKNTASTIIEMELTKSYDTSEPFINEKLFYVSKDIDSLKLNISFQMKAENGILEIADNETDQIYWSKIWNENVEETTFPIALDNLEKEKEYVIRFTGTKVKHVKIIVTSDEKLVKEREKPMKKNKN